MKRILISSFFLSFLVFACTGENPKIDKPESLKNVNLPFREMKNNKEIGFIFSDDFESKIEVVREVENWFLTIKISHFKNKQWQTEISDTFPLINYFCEKISDLNFDSKKELLIQTVEGQGNTTDYFHTLYFYKDNKIMKAHFDSIENLGFSSQKHLAYSFQKLDDRLYSGKRYSLDKFFNLRLQEEHLLSFHNKNSEYGTQSVFAYKGKKKKLTSKTRVDSLDSMFYQFLYFCD